MIAALLGEGVIARAIKQGLLDVRVWDLRDFASDRHRSTDDEAYGGGPATVGWIVCLCGRYEGFDHRVLEALHPDEISIGDFVVSGGELPAMLMADACGRMIGGVVGNNGSVEEDSFYHGLLDYPHYTRPEELRGRRVPEVLMSGHHEKIRKWRKEQSLRATLERRPDLLERAELDDEAAEILQTIRDHPPKPK